MLQYLAIVLPVHGIGSRRRVVGDGSDCVTAK